MAEVIWPQSLVDLMLEMPEQDRQKIIQKTSLLEEFPKMYSVRPSGPFRGCRWFVAGSWLVYYRVVEDKVYLRVLWPARLP
jgi:hypothetical protein